MGIYFPQKGTIMLFIVYVQPESDDVKHRYCIAGEHLHVFMDDDDTLLNEERVLLNGQVEFMGLYNGELATITIVPQPGV